MEATGVYGSDMLSYKGLNFVVSIVSAIAQHILIVILLFSISPIVFAKLSSTEEAMRDYIIQQKTAQVRLLEKLVNLNSGTANLAGVYQVGEIVKNELDQLGFNTYWADEPKGLGRAATLIAIRQGHIGKKLLLIGHLDTVFSLSSPLQRFEQKNNIAKGPGVTDDKGGIVILLYALKALEATHTLDNRTIIVVLTGDEEDSGKPTSISRQPLRGMAMKSDIAIDFEPANSINTIAISRRGIADWFISVQGNEAHSSIIFQKEVGAGAIFEAVRIVNTMRTHLVLKEEGLTFSPGMIAGGTTMSYDKNKSEACLFGKSNVVAKIAAVRGDYRFITAQQKQWFEKKLKAIVKQHLPYTKSVVTFESGIPAMPPTANNRRLLKKLSEISIDLNLGEITPDLSLRGAGDISHIAEMMSANLVGLGPTGWGSHSVNETIELNSLSTQTQRAAILIYRLTRE